MRLRGPKLVLTKMSGFTSAVPGGQDEYASAKVHPFPTAEHASDPDPKAGVAVGVEKQVAEVDESGGDEKQVEYVREKRRTFDPDSEFFRNWDIFTTLLLVFTAVVTPFEVGRDTFETDISTHDTVSTRSRREWITCASYRSDSTRQRGRSVPHAFHKMPKTPFEHSQHIA